MHQIVTALATPFLSVVDRDSPLFWPFLVSTLLIALAVHITRIRPGDRPLTTFLREFFARSIWWHRSARADYRYYLVNSILYPVIVAPLTLSGALIAVGTAHAIDAVLGPAAPAEDLRLPIVLFTIVFFIAYDLGRFIAHSLLHDIPALWEFHKAHHSAEVLTPFTNFRFHPLDIFLMHAVPSLLTGLAGGVFMHVCGREVGFFTLAGNHTLLFLCNLIGNLRHTGVWISYGRRVGHLLISPAHHQIHHSAERIHWGKNRGFELAIWDWLYGTLHVPGPRQNLTFGLGDATDAEWHGVTALYCRPIRLLLSRASLELIRILRISHYR